MVDSEKYRLYAKLPVFARRLEEARGIISGALKHMRRPYVAFSCGKDSSVLAHLVLQIAPSVPLRFLSSGETRLIHNVDEVLGYFAALGADIQEINIDRVFSEEWKDATWTEQRKAGKRDLELLNDRRFDGIFMGLRMQESRHRLISLSRSQTPGLPPFCYRYQAGRRQDMIRCCPLARWQTEDVGAYLVEHGIPYLYWYDYQGFEGRTTARLTGDAVRQGALFWIKKHDPDKWGVLLRRFPEFSLYV